MKRRYSTQKDSRIRHPVITFPNKNIMKIIFSVITEKLNEKSDIFSAISFLITSVFFEIRVAKPDVFHAFARHLWQMILNIPITITVEYGLRKILIEDYSVAEDKRSMKRGILCTLFSIQGRREIILKKSFRQSTLIMKTVEKIYEGEINYLWQFFIGKDLVVLNKFFCYFFEIVQINIYRQKL